MEGFVYAGEPVPCGGNSFPNLKMKNRYTGSPVENNFDGGDPGLNYRFWNQQADSGYAGVDVDEMSEEAAFLDNLFPCRKHCKETVGKGPNFKSCLRECRGKGLTKSALKTKEAETQAQLAAALSKMAETPTEDAAARTSSSSSKVIIWVVVGVLALAIIGVLIYFLTRKKEAAAELGAAM